MLKRHFICILLCIFLNGLSASAHVYRLEINLPALTLTLYNEDQAVKKYPVAVGTGQSPTPTGSYILLNKVIDPHWYPPRDNREPVPPGPENPLGGYWLGLDRSGYGIHGTNEPQSIGRPVTQGCIRMANEDVAELYNLLPLGSRIDITYRTFDYTVDSLGLNLIFYEDIYNRGLASWEYVLAALSQEGFPVDVICQTSLQRAIPHNRFGNSILIPLRTLLVSSEPAVLPVSARGYFFYGQTWFTHEDLMPLINNDSGLETWYREWGERLVSLIPLEMIERKAACLTFSRHNPGLVVIGVSGC